MEGTAFRSLFLLTNTLPSLAQLGHWAPRHAQLLIRLKYSCSHTLAPLTKQNHDFYQLVRPLALLQNTLLQRQNSGCLRTNDDLIDRDVDQLDKESQETHE